MDLDINFYQNYPNQDFLAQHLERWFTRYTPEIATLQMALYKSQIKSLAAQRAFAKLIKPLKSVYDFARPLLNERLHQQFGLNVDCRHVFLEEITATQPYTQGDIQPVLLAALHNFKADKPFHPASALYYRTAPWPPETSGLSTGRHRRCLRFTHRLFHRVRECNPDRVCADVSGAGPGRPISGPSEKRIHRPPADQRRIRAQGAQPI